MKDPIPTIQPKERAFLVGVDLSREDDLLSLNDSLSELALLADTAGLEVVGWRFRETASHGFITTGPTKVWTCINL